MPMFSCGGMRFQQSWRDTGQPIEPEAQEHLAATIRRGVSLGVTHIETARGYGTSERQLGMLLPELDRERLIVQTKVAPTPDPTIFRSHVRESLDRLGLERLDLLAIHGINTYEKLWWSTRPRGCLAVARQLQSEGRVGHVGFSTHGTPEMILSAIEHDGDGGFDFVNLHWYYIWQRNWPAVLAAAERDMGVFIISPADKGGRLYEPPPRLVELCRPLHPMVFNALFCLSRPQVHTLSLGAARPEDFDLSLSCLELLPRAHEFLPGIQQALAEAMMDAVGEDAAEKLLEGLPEWDRAPGFMNIKVIIWLRALVLAFGMTEYARARYNLLGNGQDWFAGLSAECADRWDLGKALHSSPWAEQVPGWLAETHRMLGGPGVARMGEA